MRNSSTNSHRQTSPIRECKCGMCGDVLLTQPGTKCTCGGLMKAFGASGDDQGMVRKAFGLEDTDLGGKMGGGGLR